MILQRVEVLVNRIILTYKEKYSTYYGKSFSTYLNVNIFYKYNFGETIESYL